MKRWFPMSTQLCTWIFLKYNPIMRYVLLVKYVLEKDYRHKRQFRFYAWTHFVNGWSKAIRKAFHTGIDTVFIPFLLLANRNYSRGCFLYPHHYLLICHCLYFLNRHLTNPALHWKKNFLKSFITHCESLLCLMFLKKICNFNLSMW